MARSFRRTFGVGTPSDTPAGGSILTLIGSIFAVIGVGLVIGAVVSLIHTRSFLARAMTATGVISDSRRKVTGDRDTFRPVVRFMTATGQTVDFTSPTATDPPTYGIGDRVEVLYDPAQPRTALIRSFFDLWGVALILGGLGLVFSAVGCGLLALRLRERIVRARQDQARVERLDLAQFGRKLQAPIREVRAEPGDVYRIVAQWLDPGARSVYVFESEPLGYDPSAYLGETIPVFIDPNDPAQYLVDLSGLPTLGNSD